MITLKLFLCTWCTFVVITFLQSWSLGASVVPALPPTLLSLAAYASARWEESS